MAGSAAFDRARATAEHASRNVEPGFLIMQDTHYSARRVCVSPGPRTRDESSYDHSATGH